jgi:hypothetical protein
MVEEIHSSEKDRDQSKDEYPPRKLVLPAMVATYLAVFLIALVCMVRLPWRMWLIESRIEQFSVQQFQKLLMNFKVLEISHGTKLHSCCHCVCFNYLLA